MEKIMSDFKRMVWYPTTKDNIDKLIGKSNVMRVAVYSPDYPNDMTMTYRFIDIQFVNILTDVTHFCVMDTPENMSDYYSRS